MTTDVFVHPWLHGLFGEADLAEVLSPARQLQHMIRIEETYLHALAHVGRIDAGAARAAGDALREVEIDIDALAIATGRDGVVVPELVSQLRAAVAPDVAKFVHTGMTSQDVIDTALILSLQECFALFERRLGTLEASLLALAAAQGEAPLMGRTRMQSAQAITVADRIDTWSKPLGMHRVRLTELRPRVLRMQFGGAVGTRGGLDNDASAIAAYLADGLGLSTSDKAWHAMRDPIAEFAGWLSLVTGTTGKMGQDIALMAQQGLDEVVVAQGGGSSAMPHKQNPIVAETLVTLARFNATLLSGMHQSLVHEQERSGAAWTLEWMLLPQMLMATGRALQLAESMVTAISKIGTGVVYPN